MTKAKKTEEYSDMFAAFGERGKRALAIILEGERIITALSDDYSTCQTAINSIYTTKANNEEKLKRIDKEILEAEHRQQDIMKQHEIELKRIANEAAERGELRSFIRSKLDRMEAEYDRYLSMDQDTFLSPVVSDRLERLHQCTVELSKEILKDLSKEAPKK